MGKLMKYEWKKQRTSRMIVMVALAVCVLTFFGGMLVEKDALMGISATLLLVGSFFVVFYMGIESILILNRDLKTKKSGNRIKCKHEKHLCDRYNKFCSKNFPYGFRSHPDHIALLCFQISV